MKFFLSPAVERIILITAIINIVTVYRYFFTCRFIPSLRLTKPLTEKKGLKPFTNIILMSGGCWNPLS